MFIIQSNEKRRNSIGLLMNIKVIFWFKTAIINTSYKFIHTYLLLLKQQICQCKRKCILCQHWNTLADYFWGLTQSFAAPKLLWEGLPSLTPRPLCRIYRLLIFFHFLIFSPLLPPPPPDYSVFWNFEMPIPPSICN